MKRIPTIFLLLLAFLPLWAQTTTELEEILTIEQQRALDLSVSLSIRNNIRYDILAPMSSKETEVDSLRWINLLKSSWSIDSKDSFYKKLEQTTAEGHTKSFKDMMEVIANNPGVPLLTIAITHEYHPFQFDRLFYVQRTQEWLGERSLRAWDLARLISVTRWAYGAGYINQKEAWECILPLAKTLYGLYNSREDFIASYIGGRGFYGAENPPLYIKTPLADYRKETIYLASRMHESWHLDGDKKNDAITREARFSDLEYKISDDQKTARAAYDVFTSSLDTISTLFEEKDYDGMLIEIPIFIEFLQDYRIGEFYPDFFYSLHAINAQLWFSKGEFAKAYPSYKELHARYPEEAEITRMTNTCKQLAEISE